MPTTVEVWIINIIMYYDVVVQVEPKRNALREATETLNAANTKLAEVKVGSGAFTFSSLFPLSWRVWGVGGAKQKHV